MTSVKQTEETHQRRSPIATTKYWCLYLHIEVESGQAHDRVEQIVLVWNKETSNHIHLNPFRMVCGPKTIKDFLCNLHLKRG